MLEFQLSYKAEDIDKRLRQAGEAVTYTLQGLTEERKIQARENIGVNPYYTTTREKPTKEHTDAGWKQEIYDLYDALPGVVPKEVKSDDGTVITYEYVISTGEYSTDGQFTSPPYFAADTDIKKPKYLVLSGIHGIERNAALSVYRFVRDVVYGHNVPQAFKEGVILHILPVGNPYGFENFTYGNEVNININRNFNDDVKAKETQAIINWLTENKDADLFIDAHNGSKLNEVLAIVGDSGHDAVKTIKKIAMRGVDRIIPFWRDVIKYPTEFKYPTELEVVTSYNDATAPNYTDVVLGKEPVIFSYCGDSTVVGSSFWYASSVLSIPSITLEFSDYCGDYSDYNKSYNKETKTATIPQTLTTYPSSSQAEMIEAVAVGAEAIGNILIEIYNQASEVIEMNSKLDTLIKQVNSGFRMESDVLQVDSDQKGTDGKYTLKIPCTSGARFFVIQADRTEIVDTANNRTTFEVITEGTSSEDGNGWFAGAFGQIGWQIGQKTERAQMSHMKNVSAQYPWSLSETGTSCTNTDGISVTTLGVKAGKYNWTAYYWNE